MAFAVTAAVVGAGATLYASNKSAKAADRASQRQADAANAQIGFSYDLWDYYKDNFGPLEGELISDARDGYQPDIEGVTGRASADVAQAYDKAKRITDRNMARVGANPGSGVMAAGIRQNALDQAKTEALAVNTARTDERRYAKNQDFNRKMAVAGLGKGIPSQVQNGLSSGGAMMAQQAQMQAQGAEATARGVAGLPWQQIGQTIGQASIPGGGGQSFTSYAQNSVNGGYWGAGGGGGGNWSVDASGNKAAYYDPANDFYAADGGYITRGVPMRPTPVDPVEGVTDNVDLNAAEGEYVIPADVVLRKGTEFFDKLLDKHHTPAAQQRLAARGLPIMPAAQGVH